MIKPSPSQHCQELAERMVIIGKEFNKLALPLRLGLLSVLSNKKISVLDRQLPELIKLINRK